MLVAISSAHYTTPLIEVDSCMVTVGAALLTARMGPAPVALGQIGTTIWFSDAGVERK